jgi:hypothetical protein
MNIIRDYQNVNVLKNTWRKHTSSDDKLLSSVKLLV